MAEKNWYPVRKSRISYDLGNSLSFESWLIGGIWRLYVRGLTAKTSIVAAVHVDLEPEDVYEEPVCFLFVARYESSRPCADIWEEWEYCEPAAVLLADKPDFATLDAAHLQEVFPKAVDGRAKFVKLCGVKDVQSLRDKIVDPLLQAVKALRP